MTVTTKHSRYALPIVDPGRSPEALHPGDKVVHAGVDVHHKGKVEDELDQPVDGGEGGADPQEVVEVEESLELVCIQ